MCTAITYKTADFYFGRTLDLEYRYKECVTVCPRNFSLDLRCGKPIKSHYAIIGMATVEDGYPLYYDGANECGLCMAGLNFPHNAVYYPKKEDCDNIAPFEFIPFLLGKCKDIHDAKQLLARINLCDISFSENFPLSPLHWIIADKDEAITVEPTQNGFKIYPNPVGVLTNNPPFDYHLTRLCDFMQVTALKPQNLFGNVKLEPYSKGMGAIGLPGDLSSSSRFIRAAFTKLNSVSGRGEIQSVNQFFHILGSVEQQRGCTRLDGDKLEITVYTSCINANRGIYYYTTYENRGISAVDMTRCDLNGNKLYTYPLIETQQIYFHN